MSSSNTKYLNFIAYLQIIGIILVVFGHSFHEFPDGHNGTSLFIYRFFYSFRMPVFLFVSGFLLSYTTEFSQTKQTPSSFIINKLKRLLLPMIVLTAITFIPRTYLSFAADDKIQLSFLNFLRSFIDQNFMPIPYFWFIHVTFILLTICFFVKNFLKKLGINPLYTYISLFIILLSYALSPLPATNILSIHELKRLGFFLIMGSIYGLTFNKIDNYISWTSPMFFLILFSLCLLTFIYFEGSLLIYISSFIGILMSISLAKIIEKNNWKFLNHLKGANFIIFLLSWYGNVLFQQILAHFINFPWWIHTLLSLIAGVYIPWVAYKYLESHQDSKWIRFTSFLLGQKFKSTSYHKSNRIVIDQ